MVILLRKKKQTMHSPSLVKGTILQHSTKNQLIQAVSPLDELLPSSPSSSSARLLSSSTTTSRSGSSSMIRFKSFSMTRRKHSSQRDQLAKLKVMGLFESTSVLASNYDYYGSEDILNDSRNNRSSNSNNSNNSKVEELVPFYTGLLSTPTSGIRNNKNNKSEPVVDDDLKQPFDLIHQGISHKSSKRTSLTSKTKNTKASKMMMNSSNVFSRNKNKFGSSSPIVSTDLYAARAGCYGGWRRRGSGGGPAVTTMMGCGGAEVVPSAISGSGLMMGGAHQVPCIISITTEFEDDDSSEISLEDVLVYMSSSSTATTSTDGTTGQPTTTPGATTFTTTTTAAASPTAAVFTATKSCMPTIFTATGWQSTDSSISWPSDEEDDEEDSDDDGNLIVFGEEEDLLVNRPPTLPMITGMKDLTFDNDGSESDFYFKPQLACSGFKFWSITEDEINGKNPPGTLIAAATRDEENCRDRDEDNQDTDRV